jgi:tRNA (mo5U34)-methyltransferase
MMDATSIVQAMRKHGLDLWAEVLPVQLQAALTEGRHGDLDRWLSAIAKLPRVSVDEVNLTRPAITVCGGASEADRQCITSQLLQLKPWRKGPYELQGVHIDTEWRSDLKWDRLAPHIQPLVGRTVLDVGSGNGYHGWRMAGEGAALVIGIDPTQLFLAQFLAVRHFIGEHWPVHLLPLGIEQVPTGLKAFDTVFSMGVLYHRRSPIDHLMELRDTLKPGGELVLETLVIDGGPGEVLVPAGRYAKMRNVWFLPSPTELVRWMQRCGFGDVRVVDVTPTSIQEQRSTAWMDFESLPDFLDRDDAGRTIEGYPAPVRAIVLATA